MLGSGSALPKAIDNTVALLIVTCPCALGLATPLAVTIALGRAARRHILVKGGEVLEVLSRPGVMFLDKTGTLPRGGSRWSPGTATRACGRWSRRWSGSRPHPIAQALVDGE